MSETEVEAWFERRRLTLDLAGLSEDQRQDGSIFLGGSVAEFVTSEDKFEYSDVLTVLFEWGDKKAADIFASMLEHDDNPSPDLLFPFNATTVVGNQLWMLAVQSQQFDPKTAYMSKNHYAEVPFDAAASEEMLAQYFQREIPRPQLIGKVGSRWVLFELGMDL